MMRKEAKWLVLFICICSTCSAVARTISDKQHRYVITVPDALVAIPDTQVNSAGDMFYDKAAGVILMISDRPSKFKSVKEYLDCSDAKLESELRTFYGDSTLQLISCRRSTYYPKEATALHFSVRVFTAGFNTFLVYFINRKGTDLQFSFTYSGSTEKQCMEYIDGIMQSLVLK